MPRTIYFSGSISGGRRDVPFYRQIVATIEAEGHRVLAGTVIADHIGDEGEPMESRAIFSPDLRWIDEADVLVAEISMPSIGVGYEIAAARYRNQMPVIALYRPAHTRRCTAMVAGDPAIRLIEYSDDSVDAMLQELATALRE